VLTYTGQLLNTIRFETLFEAVWVPAPPGTYTHRAPSPERLKEGASGLAAAPGTSAAVPAARAAGYVPPHLRGANGAATAAASSAPGFSMGFDASDKGGRIPAAARVSGQGLPVADVLAASKTARRNAAVPGAEFLEPVKPKKTKNKSKKDGGGGGGESGSAPAQPLEQQFAEQAVVSAEPAASETVEADPQKRLRALQKKLRQVQQIKQKLAAEGEAAAGLCTCRGSHRAQAV
jgi:translation initiation factor 2A